MRTARTGRTDRQGQPGPPQGPVARRSRRRRLSASPTIAAPVAPPPPRHQGGTGSCDCLMEGRRGPGGIERWPAAVPRCDFRSRCCNAARENFIAPAQQRHRARADGTSRGTVDTIGMAGPQGVPVRNVRQGSEPWTTHATLTAGGPGHDRLRGILLPRAHSWCPSPPSTWRAPSAPWWTPATTGERSGLARARSRAIARARAHSVERGRRPV